MKNPTLEEVCKARFAEIEMPAGISISEAAAVNAFLKSEWVLVLDKRVSPPLIVALPAVASATVLYRVPKE